MPISDRLSDSAKIWIRSLMAKIGIEVAAYKGSFSEHRLKLLKESGVRTLWDVGAHVGQFAVSLRDNGYYGHIVSIEPQTTAFVELKRKADADEHWIAIQAAAGSQERRGTLNISQNRQSSSLLPMLSRHSAASPSSSYTASEEVRILPIDALSGELSLPRPFALKLDVQGYELAALDGATHILSDSIVAELELSLLPLYEGGADWRKVCDRLSSAGLELCDLERVYHDPSSGDLLQVNGLFRRLEAPSNRRHPS